MHREGQNEASMTASQMKGVGQTMVSDYKNHLRKLGGEEQCLAAPLLHQAPKQEEMDLNVSMKSFG